MSSPGTETEQARRIWLTHVRQELLAPVNVVVGYAEMVRDNAGRRERQDIVPDLDRVLAAARNLSGKVDRLFAAGLANDRLFGESDVAAQQELRHELRTPLNAIQGYGELLLEDLANAAGEPLRADLECLLNATRDLLLRIDHIITISPDGSRKSAVEGQGVAGMVAELPKSLRPGRDTKGGEVEAGNILVVDDIEANRELLSRRLRREGHRVTMAIGGRQALEAMAREQFDLVLLDLMMPDMDGFEVLTRMMADELLRRIPVIMITALAESDSAVRCIEAGAVDYLPKPFDPVLLRARINACLERKRWHDREQDYVRQLEHETAKFERLLLSILPKQVIGRLNDGEAVIADRFEDASVLFADLVGFTEQSARTAPATVVRYLNRLFSEFDALAHELAAEKIKTIGDAYMVVAGIPEPRPDHCTVIARMALGMIDRLALVNSELGWPLQIRIGIHSGPVVAGIVGTHRFIYDVWGDTVNVASRLESHSLPNRIHVSQDAADRLLDGFALEPRGRIDVKGKGSLETFFLSSRAGR